MTPMKAEGSALPPARAVKCGRFVFLSVGAICLSIGGWFSYHNPNSQVLLAAAVLGAGIVLVCLGVALPPKVVAHFGFWLPWFLPSE
ncbi:MAG: hypothetical protein JWM02_3582 [Frankiales bacterium]|nr:hypothetical protein [Frankiales bacterium]